MDYTLGVYKHRGYGCGSSDYLVLRNTILIIPYKGGKGTVNM